MTFGRLERTPAPRPFSEINVTPLVDVMLVLVVIFILTAPLLASSIRLDLPRAAGTGTESPPASISVVLDAGGGLYVNERPATAEQLQRALADAAAANPDTEIQLRADRAVPYGRVVEVMGAAQQAGLNRIGFVAEPERPS